MTIEQLNSTTEQRELVLEIMNQAMIVTEMDIAHVFVQYAGHVNCVDVWADPADTDYQEEGRELGKLFRHVIRLKEDDCIDQLKQALNDINDLYDNWETSQEIVLAVQ